MGSLEWFCGRKREDEGMTTALLLASDWATPKPRTEKQWAPEERSGAVNVRSPAVRNRSRNHGLPSLPPLLFTHASPTRPRIPCAPRAPSLLTFDDDDDDDDLHDA